MAVSNIGHSILLLASVSATDAARVNKISGGSVPKRERENSTASVESVAISCLNSDFSLSDHLQTETDQMLRLARESGGKKYRFMDWLDGPKIITEGVLIHGSVYFGAWGDRAESKNCIQAVENFLPLEDDIDEFNAAASLLNNIATSLAPEQAIQELTARVNDLDITRKYGFPIHDLGEISALYRADEKEAARTHLELSQKLLAGRLNLAREKLDTHRKFFLSQPCGPFSDVARRIARFMRCLDGTDLKVDNINDGRADVLRQRGQGVYMGEATGLKSWLIMSRAASKAARFDSDWHNQTIKMLQATDDSEIRENMTRQLQSCAAKLLNADLNLKLASSAVQQEEARALRCLPALLNNPGFQGALVDEQYKIGTSENQVHAQCVMPNVCGRLGGAIMTGWQSRQYTGFRLPLTKSGKWIKKDANVFNADCMDVNSSKKFTCWDFSHGCFPQVMRYICRVLPDCCPLVDKQRCADQSSDQFLRDSSACNPCKDQTEGGKALRARAMALRAKA